MKHFITSIAAVLMILSAHAEIDPDHRTAAPGIFVTPMVEAATFTMRYHVYFTPREGNIYYRYMNNSDNEWTEWAECGKVVTFTNIGTYTLEAYAKKPGKPESAILSTTFTVAYTGMNTPPGIRLQPDDERGYLVTMNSFYDDDIFFRWKMDDGEWSGWIYYRDVSPIPFTEIGKYSIETRCDNDFVIVSFEVDRSVAGGDGISPGDVNMDGAIDVADITSLISFVLGNTPGIFFEEVANLNGDSSIDVADVTALIGLVLNSN